MQVFEKFLLINYITFCLDLSPQNPAPTLFAVGTGLSDMSGFYCFDEW